MKLNRIKQSVLYKALQAQHHPEDSVRGEYIPTPLGLVHTFRFSTGRELTGRATAQLGT